MTDRSTVTLHDAWLYCRTRLEEAEIKSEKYPDSLILRRDVEVYEALIRLLDGCMNNDAIKSELRRVHAERRSTEAHAEALPTGDAESAA